MPGSKRTSESNSACRAEAVEGRENACDPFYFLRPMPAAERSDVPRVLLEASRGAVRWGSPSRGCSSRLQQFTGSIGDFGRGNAGESGSESLAELGRRYDAKPGDKRMSLAYAAALRANGQHPQAAAVLQRTSIRNVGDREVAAAYGKVLADVGQLEQANAVLSQAHSEDRPDWRVLSTQGTIADQLADPARARELYHRARQIAPNEPTILNNLGLSYVLTKELELAEKTLRQAAELPGADDRVRANLALVLQLRGKEPSATARSMPRAASPSPRSTPPPKPRSPHCPDPLRQLPQPR